MSGLEPLARLSPLRKPLSEPQDITGLAAPLKAGIASPEFAIRQMEAVVWCCRLGMKTERIHSRMESLSVAVPNLQPYNAKGQSQKDWPFSLLGV